MLDVLINLFSVQLFSKIGTFFLNRFAANRDLSAFGACNFRYDLLFRSVVFLSREPLRRFSLRNASPAIRNHPAFSAVLWLILPLSCITSIFLLVFNLFIRTDVLNFRIGLFITCFAAIIECFSEPFFNLFQVSDVHFSRYNKFLSFSYLVKTFVSIILLHFTHDLALSFSIGYFLRSIFLLLSSLLIAFDYYSSPDFSLFFPFKEFSKIHVNPYFPLVKNFIVQTVLKFFMTETESSVLSWTLTSEQLGLFSIIQGISVFITKFLFLPIEEYVFRLLQTSSASQHSVDVTLGLSRTVFFVGFAACVFVKPFSPLISKIFLPSTYSDSVVLVVEYFLLLPLFAMNGVSEAIFHATVAPDRLTRINIVYVVITTIYVCLCVIFINLFGFLGLFVSIALNMITRVLISIKFVSFLNLRRLLPKSFVLFTLVLCSFVVIYCDVLVPCSLSDLSTNYFSVVSVVFLGLLCLFVFIVSERSFLRIFWSQKQE
ncbi:hypothetical protein RCL1_001528 [Eukaryota sp. TZLM3-RCL]